MVDIETHVLSSDSSSEESDEVQFICETRSNDLPLSNVPKNINDTTKKPNKQSSYSKGCFVTDGNDGLSRKSNKVYMYAYESAQNTSKENKSIILRKKNVGPRSKKKYSRGIFNQRLKYAGKDPKYTVAIYDISDDDESAYHEKSSLPNIATRKKTPDRSRNLNDIVGNVQQDENMNDLSEDVIIEEIKNFDKYCKSVTNDTNNIDKIKTDSIDAISNINVSKETDNNYLDTSLDVNWSMDNGKIIQKRKKKARQTSTKKQRISKLIKDFTPITDITRQSIFSTSEDDTEVDAISDEDKNKICHKIIEGEEEPTSKLFPRSTSAMSLRSLLDLYSDEVEKVLQDCKPDTTKFQPITEDSRIVFSEDEEARRTCKSCREKFESLIELTIHQCTKTQGEKRLSEIGKTMEKKQMCGDSIEDEVKKIFLWSLELSKGMLSDSQHLSTRVKNKHSRGKNKGPFICPLCNKLIPRRTKLKRHIRRHVSDTPNIYCEYCDKGFVEKYDLDRHIIAIHREQKFAFQDRNAVCPSTHQDEGKYTCHLCKLKFDPEHKYCKHISEHDINVIKESLGSLAKEEELPSAKLSNRKKSQVTVSTPPLVTGRPGASQVIITSKDSGLHVVSRQNVNSTKTGSSISVSNKQTAVSNLPAINQYILKRESLNEVYSNGLNVATPSVVDLNNIKVLNFRDTKFNANYSNITTELASLNDNNSKGQQILKNKLHLNQITPLKSYEQLHASNIRQTNKKETVSVNLLDLRYLKDTNKFTGTYSIPVKRIEVGHFSNIHNSQKMLELVDLIESNTPRELNESVSPNQLNITHYVDANQNIINDTRLPQVINQREENKSIKIVSNNQGTIVDSDDKKSKIYIKYVDSIEPMDIASSKINIRMHDYIASGFEDFEDFLENHVVRRTNATVLTTSTPPQSSNPAPRQNVYRLTKIGEQYILWR